MDAEKITKLAQLAKISISENMMNEVTDNINSILSLVDQLQAADTEGIEPMAHPMDASQRLRIDDVTEKNQRDTLQASAPAVENGLFLVPRVID